MFHFETNHQFKRVRFCNGHKRDLNINISDLNTFPQGKKGAWNEPLCTDMILAQDVYKILCKVTEESGIGHTFRKLWEGWGSSEGLNQIFTHPSVNASNRIGEPYCLMDNWADTYTPLVIFSQPSLTLLFPVSSASISSPHLRNRNLQLTAGEMRGLHYTSKKLQ